MSIGLAYIAVTMWSVLCKKLLCLLFQQYSREEESIGYLHIFRERNHNFEDEIAYLVAYVSEVR